MPWLKIQGIHNNKLLISGDVALLRRLGLGTYSESLKKYLLDVAEAAYIIYKGIAKIMDSEKELTLRDLFEKYSRSNVDWIKFTVLLDLRDRGRKARSGYSRNSLIYEKGSSRFMVFVTEENSPISAKMIIEWMEIALSKGYEPILAVVDAHGDVTYYSMYLLRPEDIRVRS